MNECPEIMLWLKWLNHPSAHGRTGRQPPPFTSGFCTVTVAISAEHLQSVLSFCCFCTSVRWCRFNVFRSRSPLPLLSFKEFICWLLLYFFLNCQATIVDGQSWAHRFQCSASLNAVLRLFDFPCLIITTPIFLCSKAFQPNNFSCKVIIYYLWAGSTQLFCLFFLF